MNQDLSAAQVGELLHKALAKCPAQNPRLRLSASSFAVGLNVPLNV